MLPRWLFTLLLSFTLTPALTAANAPRDVHEFILDNGLKILVREDARAPVVVSQVWYKVGSSYEHSGITGISHMLEHMMFKGTETYAPGEFSRIVASEGGRENAFTGRDYTAYFQQLAADRLEVSFKLESDRMANLVLLQEELDKEREVVAEERRLRTEDKPKSLAYESFMAAAFQTNPYQHPIVGWMADIQNYELEDLKAWYRRWYAPNNATLVVVGDVVAAEVVDLAKKYFGPIPSAKTRPPKHRPEVEQRGPRRITVVAPVKVPYLLMGYKVPSMSTADEDWEPYALAVLAAVLDGDDSSRFSRDLVRGEQIASRAGADYSPQSRYSTLMLLDGTPAVGRSVAEMEKALRAQVERLKTTLVDERELTRIKTQVVAADVYQRDSVFFQAMRLGILETVGLGWQTADEYVSRIKAVTAEQVQDVARRYLTEERLTVALLEPEPAQGDLQAMSGDTYAN